MRIMIVDDEESVLMLLRELLQTRGYEVVTARNGREALDRLAHLSVDMVVSDIYMPMMDGIRLHENLRAEPRTARLPVLFISGYNDHYTAGAVRDPKREAFWGKGSSVDLFVKWVDYLVQPDEKKSKLRPDGTEVPPFVGGREENSGQ
jgi:CheY-like chemotaxis protein